MAITTMDGLVAAMLPSVDVVKAAATAEAVGVLFSTFYTAGIPGAAATVAPGLNGATLTSYSGQIPFPASSAGKNIHLVNFEATQATNIGSVSLYDRLWHNSGFTVTTTTAQTITTFSGLPSRDRNGATSGEGVMLGIEVSVATTNGSAITNMTASYTNSGGTSGRTATVASFPATAVAGSFIPFVLQAGDTGVQSVQSLTLGTSLVTGTVHLVCYRQIATLGTPVANVSNMKDGVQLGLPRMYDNSVPWLVLTPTGTAMGIVDAQVTYAQG